MKERVTTSKGHLDYIVFAINQAKDAQKFGFTRNHCTRNLRTALHQHWQNKIMGLSGITMKEHIPRSKAAVGKPKSETIVEHVVPVMLIMNMLMDHKNPTPRAVQLILKKYYHVRLVTKEEDARLRESGLRSKMPDSWDRVDIWARYEAVGIELAE